MKPERKLAETTIRSGARLTLHEHDGSYAIRLNGQTLMLSVQSASELLLGELAIQQRGLGPVHQLRQRKLVVQVGGQLLGGGLFRD